MAYKPLAKSAAELEAERGSNSKEAILEEIDERFLSLWPMLAIPAAAFLHSAVSIGSNANLNSFDKAGIYYQSNNARASSGSNYPEAKAGALLVLKSAGVNQIYVTYNDGSPELWMRGCYSGNWSVWQKNWHSRNFNPSTYKAPNADKLDGLNSSDFLRSGGKAVDADKLDGLESRSFLRRNVDDFMVGRLSLERKADEQLRIGYNTGATRNPHVNFYNGLNTRRGYIQALGDRFRVNRDGGACLDLHGTNDARINGHRIYHKGMSHIDVSSFVFASRYPSGSSVYPGQILSGSSLRLSSGDSDRHGEALPGSWRCHGHCNPESDYGSSATVFMRVA